VEARSSIDSIGTTMGIRIIRPRVVRLFFKWIVYWIVNTFMRAHTA
jgi:hypothetical protein